MAEQPTKAGSTVEEAARSELTVSQAAPSPDEPTTCAAGMEQVTADAPPRPAPLADRTGRTLPSGPREGERVGDFQLLRLLGEGSFARVFLARQLSLHRLVALKISTHDGSEALTLAQLEHEHIVRVFADTTDPATRLRLLCMQYVPGTTLDRVIVKLKAHPTGTWSGRDFLAALDSLCTQETIFDPAALRTRELLEGCDFVECVCWIGSRLAEALAHAHGQGVLHRDIKPANILLNRYGKPLLADFNVAQAPEAVRNLGPETFGGTLAYMAPEHMEAFGNGPGAPAQVGECSDIYSLAVVLYELAAGELPFPPLAKGQSMSEALLALIQQRREGVAVRLGRPGEGEALSQVIGRCLEPDPEQRCTSAAELMKALEGCRELRRVGRELPPGGKLVHYAQRFPFLWLALLALAPHCVASIVNITYNSLRIVLTAPQHDAFARVTLIYNLVVYSLCLFWLWRLVAPVVQAWRGLDRRVEAPRLAAIRRQVLRLPRAAAIISALGWLPGGILFPLAINWWAGKIEDTVCYSFLISFTISGLIALTYSVFGVQFVVLRILYPRLCGDGQCLQQETGRELAAVGPRLWALQLLAVLIPLAAAVLLVGITDEPGARNREFRWLVIGLIGLGTAGFLLAVSVSAFLNRTLTVLTGGKQPTVPAK